MEDKTVLKAKNIKAVLTDIDGVMTDGTLYYMPENQEHGKAFFVRDGLAVKLAHLSGLPVYFISAKQSEVLGLRARELGVDGSFDGVRDKVKIAEKIAHSLSCTLSECCYIGDDLIDLPLLKKVGFSATVNDCAEELKSHVDYISPFKGGKGGFRDIIEFIIKSRGHWETVLSEFGG